ncbi:MAG: hypothetical protein SFU98_22625 [Leptospiraceae bacterium]|nr:hypothetical protein [Leptospiraceae bacterium]
MSKAKLLTYGIGTLFSVLYGLACQYSIRNKENAAGDFIAVMSVGFIFIFPFALGFSSVFFATDEEKKSIAYKVLAPMISSILSLFISMLVGWEGTICLIMALPIYVVLAIVGGFIAGLLSNITSKSEIRMISLAFVLLSPFIVTESENYFELPSEVRTVNTQIEMNASAETVWKKIIRIPEIKETQTGFFYKMGFPKPVEATLDKEGVGGVRIAKFEKGLLFVETITRWEDKKLLTFKIKSDPSSTPLTTLDPHVVVGGRYFDTLLGEYEIETISDKKVILHLFSKYRLSTRFNFYAAWWGDYLMEDIQNNILNVLKERAENEERRLSNN